jgi:hypothetical protein
MGPYEFAKLVRVQIVAGRYPWSVASDGDRAFVTRDTDPDVTHERVWEGVAQCLLTRRGVEWSDNEAQRLAAMMRANEATLH